MTTWAILPAGGSSQRFGSNKLARVLGNKPLLAWSIQTLLNHPSIDGLVIAAPEAQWLFYQNLLQPFVNDEKPLVWVEGGATRRESVYQGLLAIPAHVGTVMIHDAARPFVSNTMIVDVLAALSTHSGAIVAIPVGDTLKQASVVFGKNQSVIEKTLPRESLWQAQTPQAFHRSVLLQAHKSVDNKESITDDAQLLELSGLGPVALVQGSPQNIKLTHPEDWALVETLAGNLWQNQDG